MDKAVALPGKLTIEGLRRAYAEGDLKPEAVIREVVRRVEADADNPIWITPPTLDALPRRGSGLVLDAAQPHDTALILYSSGTTGKPKGAPLSHANLLAGAHAVRLAWRWTPEDTLALCLPLFHMHGLGVGLHGTLVTGAAALIHPFSPQAVADAIDQGVTLFFGVPTMYHRLAESPHLAALSRLLPLPPNFAPIEAMALFGGAYFARRHLAFLVPLLALLASDLALGALRGGTYLAYFTDAGYLPSLAANYLCTALTVGLAFGLRGSMERVTNRVFLLTPPNIRVSDEEKQRIADTQL